MTPHIYGILEAANAIKDDEDRKIFIRNTRNTIIDILFKMAYDPAITFALPEGTPPFKEANHPENNCYGNIYSEMARIQRVFLTGTLPEMKSIQRENLFIGVLEFLNKDDAKLLIAVKDKALPKLFKKLNEKFVREALPELFNG